MTDEIKTHGYMTLSRKIQTHWIYKDPVKLKWWLMILFAVNYQDKNDNIGNQVFLCKRGECIKSLHHWAEEWKVTPKTARNFFLMLQKDKMITYENIGVSIRISVCNYDKYQLEVNDKETQKETERKRKGNAKETGGKQELPTSNKDNKEDNINEIEGKKKNLKETLENKIKENDFSEIKISDCLENSEEEKKEIVSNEKITIILNPEEKKEEKSSAKKEEIKRKESDKLYKTFCKCYNTFCLSKLGHNAKFDGAEGKAASNIVKWCRDNHYDENKIKDVFEFIFKNWDKLPEFYQMGVTLHSVDRNLINIMNWFKNGRDTREYQKRKAEDEYKEFFNNI